MEGARVPVEQSAETRRWIHGTLVRFFDPTDPGGECKSMTEEMIEAARAHARELARLGWGIAEDGTLVEHWRKRIEGRWAPRCEAFPLDARSAGHEFLRVESGVLCELNYSAEDEVWFAVVDGELHDSPTRSDAEAWALKRARARAGGTTP